MKFATLVAVLAASGLVVAGCGGGGGSTNTTSKAAARDAQVKFSQCMREHGVKNFPDPDANGGILVEAGPGTGLDPQSPTFKSAQQACKKYQPKTSGTFDPKRAQQMEAQALAFARCMRAHGVDFPDPKFTDGGRGVEFGGGKGSNPNDPAFQSASQTCAKNVPGASGPGPGSGGGLALGGGK
jgi:hypothetical protein